MNNTEQKLDDATAEAMLKQLAEHYGEPVLPAGRFCNKMRQWFQAVHEGAERERQDERMGRSLQALSEAIYAVNLAIYKSACLDRLIYGGEDIRTEPCPVHKGRWSGCAFKLLECANEEYPQGCMAGSNVTGWLPTPEQVAEQREWFAKREHKTCETCGKRFHKTAPESDCPYCVEKSWNGKCFCVS